MKRRVNRFIEIGIKVIKKIGVDSVRTSPYICVINQFLLLEIQVAVILDVRFHVQVVDEVACKAR